MNRREFLAITGIGLAGGLKIASAAKDKRPNILYILTDQQSATMMSCTGNKWLKTPAMDSLMKRGMRFERAYATNPVCMPARFSFLTGRYPSAIGVRANGGKHYDSEKYVGDAIGWTFRRAGYNTVYGGKVHLHGALRNIEDCGFTNLTGNQRDELADKSAEFLREKHDKPFLLFVSLINPHDICYQGLFANGDMQHALNRMEGKRLREAEQFPEGVGEKEFYEKHCPPLPPNHAVDIDEPEALKYVVNQRPFKKFMRDNWGDKEWRLHRWAYARLTEVVDGQIARVLDALRESGLEDNTVVILTSDHGDMDSSHGLEHKSMTYEEAARIPLMVQYPPLTKAGLVDRDNLVSNGLDVFPTLCDLAGVKCPDDLPGRSFKPLLGGAEAKGWRRNLVVETEFGAGLIAGQYKYTIYDIVKPEEELFDLKVDPCETKNLAKSQQYQHIVKRMRRSLARQTSIQKIKEAARALDA